MVVLGAAVPAIDMSSHNYSEQIKWRSTSWDLDRVVVVGFLFPRGASKMYAFCDTNTCTTGVQHLHLKVSVLLYGICLVSTLVCAVADTTILNAQGYSSDSWYEESLYDAGFRRKVIFSGMEMKYFALALPWVGSSG